jgi:hypothetical protein
MYYYDVLGSMEQRILQYTSLSCDFSDAVCHASSVAIGFRAPLGEVPLFTTFKKAHRLLY